MDSTCGIEFDDAESGPLVGVQMDGGRRLGRTATGGPIRYAVVMWVPLQF